VVGFHHLQKIEDGLQLIFLFEKWLEKWCLTYLRWRCLVYQPLKLDSLTLTSSQAKKCLI
jgi:hypothetical protein